jgi:dienelactone hydrolase
MRAALLCLLLANSVRGDEPFRDVNPNVLPPDPPPAKMLAVDAKKRTQEASERESKAFADVTTREQWEAFRDVRIKALRDSLGSFPTNHEVRVEVTGATDGVGFRVENLLYESRPAVWVTANLYLPAKPAEKMPGFLISHSHHAPKTEQELQDMGMTWARSGCAVLIPDHLGHGERRQHHFRTAKDFDKPFRPGRQDYFFRYTSNQQLSLTGDSLMGWMVNDLMRGVDVLLKQPGIDRDRIILLGAVAGGGDPAGVTAALDKRIACVVPFNFGGWQPESSVQANPDRDFAWFGDGYWESTRGLRNGARDGFAHWVVVGAVAPRKVIYAHEFAWDAKTDPAWPRLQKVFGFYNAAAGLRTVHGEGSVRGSGPGNTHCNNIGAVHRKGIHEALKDWFGIPVPTEYRKFLPAENLTCWTDAARVKLKPRALYDLLADLSRPLAGDPPADPVAWARDQWRAVLGDTEPRGVPNAREGMTQEVPGGTLSRFALAVEPGIAVPLLLIKPTGAKGKVPAVLMVAQAGKGAFLKHRGEAIRDFLKNGVAVCLVDVRGTGETRAGDSAGRTSSRTSLSQTNLILGTPLLGAQVRDLRTVARWLAKRDDIDGSKLAAWGESFAPASEIGDALAFPHDAPNPPPIGEPGAALLAYLACLFEDGVRAFHATGGVAGVGQLFASPYLYLPHDALPPGVATAMHRTLPFVGRGKEGWYEGTTDGCNRPAGLRAETPAKAVARLTAALTRP